MKPSQILKSCLNPKVIIGIATLVVFAYIFVPQLAQYSWVLLVLICPLSMIFMMAVMNNGPRNQNKVFVCPECGLKYKEREWAKKCQAWCGEHKSCNVEIIKQAITGN